MELTMWIFCLFILSVSSASGEVQMCTNVKLAHENCLADDCTTVREQPCFHGDCTKTGECHCHPCWAGEFCNITDNKHPPVFREPSYEAIIPPDSQQHVPFLYISASDGDRSRCDWGKECQCADVVYSLNPTDKHAPKLSISPLSGGIYLDEDGPLQSGVYEYKVSVANLDGLQGSNSLLTVIVEDDSKWSGVVKSRKLRAAPATTGLTAVGNTSLVVSIEVDPANAPITTISPGDNFTINFKLTIPANSYAEDVLIEIFTDDANGTFAILCKPVVTAGNIHVDPDRITPVMGSHTEGFLVSSDSAILDLGVVANPTVSDSKLIVTYTVTIVDDPTIKNGHTYWISSGVEHYQGSRIWIGQLGFTVSRNIETIPATVINLDGPTSAPVGQPHKFTLDIRTFKRAGNMTVEVSTPNPLLNSICKMEICSFGSGFCVDEAKADVSYTLTNVTFGHNSDASVPLGLISYAGSLSDNVNSVITLDVILYVKEDAAGAGAQTLNAVVTEDGTDTVNDFTYTPAAATPSTSGHTLGVTAAASCTGNPCQLIYSQAVEYEVALSVPSGAYFTPVTVNFESDLLGDGTPALAACGSSANAFYQIDDDIAYLGKWIKRGYSFVDTQDPKGPVFELGGLMNMGYSGATNATVKLGVVLTVSPNAVAATTYNMNIKVYAAGALVQTDVLPMTLSANPTVWPALSQSDPTPAVMVYELVYPLDTYDVRPGSFAVFRLKITPEPSTQYPYVLSVGANSTSLRLLDFRITYVGNAFKCSDRDAWKSAVGTITVGDGSTLYDTSDIDMGVVIASRWTNIAAETKDSIRVEAVVQLSDDRATVGNGSLHPVAMSVFIGGSRFWVGEGSIRGSYSVVQPIVAPTVNNLTFDVPVVDTVTPGARSNLVHTLTLTEATSFNYVINYTTDHTWMNITGVEVQSVGGYLPGLLLRPATIKLGSHSGGNYAVVDLGFVSNIRLDPAATATDVNNMTVVLQVSVEVANSSAVDRGSWGVVAANVVVGNGDATQTVVSQVSFKANLPKTVFNLTCPDTAFSMKPGEVEACNITITVLDDELPLRLEIESALNNTATLNLMEANVLSVGRNIIGDLNTGTIELTSGDNTTQNNKAVAVGTTGNSFTHTTATGTYQEGDNIIVINIVFQMTDADGNEPGSSQRIDIGASAGTYMVWVCSHNFSVERDGSERPILDVSYSHTANDNLVPGNSVFYHVNVSHNPSSNAEAINLQVRLSLPLYINFTQLIIQNTNDKFPVPSSDVSGGGVVLSVGRLFLTDSIQFTVETIIDSNYIFRTKSTFKGTTPLQVVYQQTDRAGSSFTPGEFFVGPIQYETYNFTVTPAPPDGTSGPTCTTPVALGMADGTIQDCHIKGSFQPHANAAPSHARLNGASAWKTEARGGPFLSSRWLKVDLGRQVTLTSIETQGGSSGDIGSFDLLYSVNDVLYKEAVPTDQFNHRKSNPASGTILSNNVVQHALKDPVEARYVVVQLTNYDFSSVNQLYNMLRVEFYGCTATSTLDPCPTPVSTYLHEYDRGFTVAGNTLFVCDSQGLDSGLRRKLTEGVYGYNWSKQPKMQCFVTNDGQTWDAMPTKVHNVIGYLPTDDTIYAIFEYSSGYAEGKNFGATWNMISTADYQTAAANPAFVTYTPVPLIPEADLSEQVVGSYKATFDGISWNDGGTWKPILDWKNCCTPQCKLSGIDTC